MPASGVKHLVLWAGLNPALCACPVAPMRRMGASSENLSKYCAFYEDHPGGGPCPLLDRKEDLGNTL